jgi:hypothetical protein
MKSFCKEHCGYFSEGAKVDGATYGYGCGRYGTALHCPVSYVKNVSATEYEIGIPDGSTPIVEYCAQSCCPDPVVRLNAMADPSIESVDSLRRKAELSDRAEPKAMIDRLDAILSQPIQIGAVED